MMATRQSRTAEALKRANRLNRDSGGSVSVTAAMEMCRLKFHSHALITRRQHANPIVRARRADSSPLLLTPRAVPFGFPRIMAWACLPIG